MMELSGLARRASLLALLGLASCALLATKAGYGFTPWEKAQAVDHSEHLRKLSSEAASWQPFVDGTERQGKDHFDVPLELLVIVSANRSGAMQLSMDLARRNLCLYSCNDFFGDMAAIPCRHAVWHEFWGPRKQIPLDVARESRDKLCSTRMPKCWHNPRVPNDVVKECWKTCATVLFVQLQNQVHGKKLLELLWYRGTRVVVLERDPAARKCSLDWAQKNGDTSLDPTKHKYSPFGAQKCSDEAPAHFVKTHNAWYGEVRYHLQKHNISRLEVTYSALMGDREATLRKIEQYAGL